MHFRNLLLAEEWLYTLTGIKGTQLLPWLLPTQGPDAGFVESWQTLPAPLVAVSNLTKCNGARTNNFFLGGGSLVDPVILLKPFLIYTRKGAHQRDTGWGHRGG